LFIAISSLIFGQDAWKGDEYAKNSESQKASAEDFMQALKFKGDEAVLDVGCGDGKITAMMAKAVPQGSVVGVDISKSMVEYAVKAFSKDKNLSFQVQDAARLSFENQFDLITSFTVMQWVLEQSSALQCFAKALKAEGRVLIQMPTGLPLPMSQAVKKTISKEKWASHFKGFVAPWRFYQPDEYRTLLMSAHLTPVRIDLVTKHEKFPSRAAFHEFLRQWFPYLRPLPYEMRDRFLMELLDEYLKILPPDESGKVSFIVERLEAEATKNRTRIGSSE
jgi:trans-aconitate methyltransferase